MKLAKDFVAFCSWTMLHEIVVVPRALNVEKNFAALFFFTKDKDNRSKTLFVFTKENLDIEIDRNFASLFFFSRENHDRKNR